MFDNLFVCLFFFFITDIKEDYDLSGYVPDFSFPVAACKITQCSTFAVVCRLKSHKHVVTSKESELVWPEFPLAKVTFPQNAVPQGESFEVTAKVGIHVTRGLSMCLQPLTKSNELNQSSHTSFVFCFL